VIVLSNNAGCAVARLAVQTSPCDGRRRWMGHWWG